MQRLKKGLLVFSLVTVTVSSMSVTSFAQSNEDKAAELKNRLLAELKHQMSHSLGINQSCDQLEDSKRMQEILLELEQLLRPDFGGNNRPNQPDKPITPPDTEKPDPDQPDTDIPDTDKPDADKPDKPDTDKPDADKPGTDKPDTDKPDSDNSQPDQGLSAYAQEVVRLVNAERAKAGLSALTVDTGVQNAAQVRAKEQQSLFSHTRPNGSSCFTALAEAGVSYRGAGENIAMGQQSAQSVMNSWMNSSGHRANILSAQFTKIGVGVHQDQSGKLYWTQMFTY